MNYLVAVLKSVFEVSHRSDLVLLALYTAGLWGIFRKSGVKGWWALVPWARESKLGQCAGRELEGRICASMTVGFIALDLVKLLLRHLAAEAYDNTVLMLTVFQLMLVITRFVYHIQIFISLCDVYDRRHKWVWLWMTPFTRFIPALLWGWRKQYQPAWQVEEIRRETMRAITGHDVSEMGEGLTVNLTERTTTEFFKKKYLLRDIHLNIQPGHMVLLLGGSGAGKTTFLNAVNGYEKAKAKVTLNGGDVYGDYKKMQYEIGFVPQQELMRGKDTVLHTLLDASMLRLPANVSKADRLARVEEVLKMFGMSHAKNHMVEKMSGGQKKRLSIAMEFLSNPSLFILDEPDSGLDGVMARKLMTQLRQIADQGKIVIVITHTPDRVVDLFDDVIVLAKDSHRVGRLAFFGPIEEARRFFGKERMEEIVMSINRPEEGGEGRADELIHRYAEVRYA